LIDSRKTEGVINTIDRRNKRRRLGDNQSKIQRGKEMEKKGQMKRHTKMRIHI